MSCFRLDFAMHSLPRSILYIRHTSLLMLGHLLAQCAASAFLLFPSPVKCHFCMSPSDAAATWEEGRMDGADLFRMDALVIVDSCLRDPRSVFVGLGFNGPVVLGSIDAAGLSW